MRPRAGALACEAGPGENRHVELPDDPVLGELIQRYARLVARLSDEIGERPLVLPNAEFFPDVFTGDRASLKRLAQRMRAHAGLTDIPIRAQVSDEPEEDTQGGASCCGGGCSVPEPGTETTRLIDEGDGWLLMVPAAVAGHGVALTTHVAQALGRIFLTETSEDGRSLEQPVGVTAEIAGVALGFGALLLQGSYVYQKSCGGPRVARLTELSTPELAVLLALFIRLGERKSRAAHRALDPTQQAAFAEGLAWVDANRALIDLLRRDPERVGRGDFAFAQSKSWLGRVFGHKARSAPTLAELEASLASMPRPARTGGPDPKREELSRLVAEALADSAPGSKPGQAG